MIMTDIELGIDKNYERKPLTFVYTVKFKTIETRKAPNNKISVLTKTFEAPEKKISFNRNPVKRPNILYMGVFHADLDSSYFRGYIKSKMAKYHDNQKMKFLQKPSPDYDKIKTDIKIVDPMDYEPEPDGRIKGTIEYDHD